MPNIEEQRLDVISNCDYLLQNILKPFDQTDDTPEGRMIAQLKWLKERAEKRNLSLPVDETMLSTLRRVYVDGELCRHASTRENAHQEVEIYLDRLIQLTKYGRLLLKPDYFSYAGRYINALVNLLRSAHRPLSEYEQGAIPELERAKSLLLKAQIEPPLASYFPDYPCFRKVSSITGNSTDDLPNGKVLTKTVASLLFEGVRPDSWLSPEAADGDTQSLL